MYVTKNTPFSTLTLVYRDILHHTAKGLGKIVII